MNEFWMNFLSSIVVGLSTGLATGCLVSYHFAEKTQVKESKLHMLRIKGVLEEINIAEVFGNSNKTLEDLFLIRAAAKQLIIEQRAILVIDEKAKQWLQMQEVIKANEKYVFALRKACADSGMYSRNMPLKTLGVERLRELSDLKSKLEKSLEFAVSEIKS